jgi:pimeloyl-ACP methyl ester carboxylesterase
LFSSTTNANALTWKPQIRALASRFRVYALDIPGSPGRSATARLPERGPASGAWLTDVLDALEIATAHVVGISGGTAIIPKLASVAPRRVRSAVLMSATGFIPLRFPFRLSRIPVFLAAVDQLNALTVRSPADARRFLARTSAPGVMHDDETAELFAIVMRAFRSQPPPDALPDAEQRALTAPALLLMGELEIFFDPRRVIAQAHRVLRDLRAAEVVPSAGHALASDRPDLVNARLVRFFAEVG